VGYAGGSKDHPTYQDLGDHTETLQIEFDPTKITYAQLLDLFWASHNPCRRTGNVQYRAAVFCHSPEQKQVAEAGKSRLEAEGKTVATEILPAGRFWAAEDYHQKYYLRSTREMMREFDALYPNPKAFRDSTAAARVNGWLAGNGSLAQVRAEIDRCGLSDAAKQRLLERDRE